MVSNVFDTLEDSLSLLWSIVTFLGKAFPLLLLRHLLDASLIFVTRMVRSPTRVPASRKRERVDTPLTLKGLTQKRHTIFWLTSHWQNLVMWLHHMATPYCEGSWTFWKVTCPDKIRGSL